MSSVRYLFTIASFNSSGYLMFLLFVVLLNTSSGLLAFHVNFI